MAAASAANEIKDTIVKEENCCICLARLGGHDTIGLKCLHQMHVGCLKTWCGVISSVEQQSIDANITKFGKFAGKVDPATIGDISKQPVCHVCVVGMAQDNTRPLLTCVGCNAVFHDDCHPLRPNRDGQPHCKTCFDLHVKLKGTMHCKILQTQERHCVLCPGISQPLSSQDRVLVEVDSKRVNPSLVKNSPMGCRRGQRDFVHLSCKTWLFGIDADAVYCPVLVDRMGEEYIGKRCSVCETSHGACAQCTFPGCSEHFHITCGLRAGMRFDTRFDKKSNTWFNHTYCEKHVDVADRVPANPTNFPRFPLAEFELAVPEADLDHHIKTLVETLTPEDRKKREDFIKAKTCNCSCPLCKRVYPIIPERMHWSLERCAWFIPENKTPPVSRAKRKSNVLSSKAQDKKGCPGDGSEEPRAKKPRVTLNVKIDVIEHWNQPNAQCQVCKNVIAITSFPNNGPPKTPCNDQCFKFTPCVKRKMFCRKCRDRLRAEARAKLN